MPKNVILCIVSLAACGLPSMGRGSTSDNLQSTLYVSPNGDNANPGTESQPFASIDKARDAVRMLNKNMTVNAG